MKTLALIGCSRDEERRLRLVRRLVKLNVMNTRFIISESA
jgi:hypothetical protein